MCWTSSTRWGCEAALTFQARRWHSKCIVHGMDSGLYAAYTGLLARTQALDTAANNLANAGTVGFRAQRDYFRSVLAGTRDRERLPRRLATRSMTSACWAAT